MEKVSSKMLVGEVTPRIQGLQTLLDKNLPIKVAYKLGKIVNALADEAKAYEEARIKLGNQLSNKDSEGNPVIKDGAFDLTPEARLQFEKDHAELFMLEVEVTAPVISLEEFKDIEASARELLLLGDFLVEEQE